MISFYGRFTWFRLRSQCEVTWYFYPPSLSKFMVHTLSTSKYERASRPWGHGAKSWFLNTGTLNWQSSTLTTTPFFCVSTFKLFETNMIHQLFLKHRILKFRWLRKIWHRACKGPLATMRTFFIRNIYPKNFASPYFLAILGMSGSLTLVVSASFLLISPQCVT